MPTEVKTPAPTEEGAKDLASLIAEEVGAVDEAPIEQPEVIEGDEPAQPDQPEGEPPESKEPEQPEAPETPENKETEPPKSAADKAVDEEIKALGITNEKSQARFRELANKAAEVDRFRERLTHQDQVFEHMEKQGITGEQFGQMVAVVGDINSGDPARLQRAHAALMAELTQLSKRLGVAAPGYDPLSEYPDLAEKVKSGALDAADAQEIARLKHQQKLTQASLQQRTQADEMQAAEVRVRAELNALGQQLKATDPDYDRKIGVLLPTMKPILAKLPPSERVTAFAEAYRNLPPMPAPVAQTKRPDPSNPARPKSGAGQAVPKTAAEAVMAALGVSPSA